jgi:hypothetical protein
VGSQESRSVFHDGVESIENGSQVKSARLTACCQLTELSGQGKAALKGYCIDAVQVGRYDGRIQLAHIIEAKVRRLLTGRSAAVGGISDRKQEIKRRRKRRAKITHFKHKLKKATTSEKLVMAEKIRRMTPGAETIITDLALEERK